MDKPTKDAKEAKEPKNPTSQVNSCALTFLLVLVKYLCFLICSSC